MTLISTPGRAAGSKQRWALCGLALLALVQIGCRTNQEIELLHEGKEVVAISFPAKELRGYNAIRLQEDLKVRLVDSDSDILGTYSSELGRVRFEPVWPFSPGLTYDVYWKEDLYHSFQIPMEVVPATTLTAVYPSLDTLPQNLLKLYFEFSSPMGNGVSYDYLSLVNQEEDTVNDAFLFLQPELWNENRTILTVWLDPGRIKRDLGPNAEFGPPLIVGETYTIHIDSLWPDATGSPLMESSAKRFHVVEADRSIPAWKDWEVSVPRAGSTDTLSVRFGEPLDAVLLREAMMVTGGSGGVVGGMHVSDFERVWQFIPTEPWVSGAYEIVVESRIEDLAGNNLNRPFDRDLLDEPQLSSTEATHAIAFEVK